MTDEMSSLEQRTAKKREGGVALIMAVLLLITVSALALATMDTATSDGQVAGFQNQEQVAFFAAEAGMADARAVVRNLGSRTEVPNYPADFPDQVAPRQLADSADFEVGAQPIYFADPNPALTAPIEYVGEGSACTEGCNNTIGGLKYNNTKWRINVVGQAPSGDQKRIEAVATRLLPVGY